MANIEMKNLMHRNFDIVRLDCERVLLMLLRQMVTQSVACQSLRDAFLWKSVSSNLVPAGCYCITI